MTFPSEHGPATTGYGAFTTDPDGRIATWPDGISILTGYTAADVVGQYYGLLFTPTRQAERLPETALEIAAREGLFQMEGQAVRKDGSEFHTYAVATPIMGPDNSVAGFAVVTHDRTRADVARQEQEKWRAVAQLLNLTLWTSDADGQITFISENWEATANQSVAEAAQERQDLIEREQLARTQAERRAEEDRALRESIAAVNRPFTSKGVADAIALNAVRATESVGALVLAIDKDHDTIEVMGSHGEVRLERDSFSFANSMVLRELESDRENVVVRKLKDYEGPFWPNGVPEAFREWSALVAFLTSETGGYGVLVVLRNEHQPPFTDEEIQRITTYGTLTGLALQKLRLLEEAKRQEAELTQVNDSRSRLMLGFGQDVKEPLGQARQDAVALDEGGKGPVPDTARDSVQRIRRSLDESLHLIDDLLELAETQSGQLSVEPEPVDLARIAADTTEEFCAQADAQALALEVAPSESLRLTVDPERVRQVLSNLLSNALKYTEGGGASRCAPDGASATAMGGASS